LPLYRLAAYSSGRDEATARTWRTAAAECAENIRRATVPWAPKKVWSTCQRVRRAGAPAARGDEVARPWYAGERCPPEVGGHAAWRSCRFARSDRDGQELLAARGVVLPAATIRRWCRECGQADANGLRRRRPRPGDTRHRDAAFLGSHRVQHARWRAVDQDGTVRASTGLRKCVPGYDSMGR